MATSPPVVFALASGALLLAAACAPAPDAPLALAIENVGVIDVANGRVVPGQTVLVEGDRIAAVGATAAMTLPSGIRRIDGSGQFLMPGLWDMHVHLADWDDDPAVMLLVANGVLGVREMGDDLDGLRALQARIANGALPHLRTAIAGRMLDGPTDNWPLRITVATPKEGVEAVRAQIARGVDFIKVHQQLDRPTYLAIAEEARTRGIPFAGHVPRDMTGIEAANAGQATIEHLTGTPWCNGEDCSPMSATLDAYLATGVQHVPTLSVYDAGARWVAGKRVRDGLADYVNERAARWWATQDSVNAGLMPSNLDKTALEKMMIGGRAGALRATRALAAAGVPILTGTDLAFPGVIPGFGMHHELRLLVEAGLTPAMALRAATVGPATQLGLGADLGTIEVGKLADLVLLEANPLEEIGGVGRIAAVVTNGTLLDRAALDTLLAKARDW